MQLLTTMVGLSIGASAMPMVMQMAITPAITQVKANNFGIAETSAVTYAALNEGQEDFTDVPEGCDLEELGNEAYKITCTKGERQFKATVTRAFRNFGDMPQGYSGNQRIYEYATPQKWGPHQCLDSDPWGVQWWNDLHGVHVGACTPQPFFSKAAYLASNPADWLYDMNGVNGWGSHPDY